MKSEMVLDSISHSVRISTLLVTVPNYLVWPLVRHSELSISTTCSVNVFKNMVGSIKPVSVFHESEQRFLVTSTKWQTVTDRLRENNLDANYLVMSNMLCDTLSGSVPRKLTANDWHVPFIDADDCDAAILTVLTDLNEKGIVADPHELGLTLLRRVSAVRCARLGVDTLKDDRVEQLRRDVTDFAMLSYSLPRLYPEILNHQATPDYVSADSTCWLNPSLHGNSPGWCLHKPIYAWEAWRDRT